MRAITLLAVGLAGAAGCGGDALAPQTSLWLQMIEITGELDVLDTRPGRKHVRVSLLLYNSSKSPIWVGLPSDCVVARARPVDGTPDVEFRATDCHKLTALPSRALWRLDAEPEWSFGRPAHRTQGGGSWVVTARLKGVRINWGHPQDSDEIVVGTVNLEP